MNPMQISQRFCDRIMGASTYPASQGGIDLMRRVFLLFSPFSLSEVLYEVNQLHNIACEES